MKFIVMDTEGDGLAYDCTKLHVMGWTYDGETIHTTNDYKVMREVVEQPDTKLVAHNSIRHDLVALNRIIGSNLTYLNFVDTLALSWTIHYDRVKHGLESYGPDYGFAKPKVDDWKDQPYEVYRERVTEDVKINWALWKDLERKLGALYGWVDV